MVAFSLDYQRQEPIGEAYVNTDPKKSPLRGSPILYLIYSYCEGCPIGHCHMVTTREGGDAFAFTSYSDNFDRIIIKGKRIK